MVSLDLFLELFLVLMSTRHPTFANFRKQKLETSFLQHESKIEDSLRFFPDYNDASWEPLICSKTLSKTESKKVSDRPTEWEMDRNTGDLMELFHRDQKDKRHRKYLQYRSSRQVKRYSIYIDIYIDNKFSIIRSWKFICRINLAYFYTYGSFKQFYNFAI